MIIVKLYGGLGNQMFIYAAGRYLALKHNTTLKLDITDFKTSINRYYQLNLMNINAEIASNEDINRIKFNKFALIANKLLMSKIIPKKYLYKNYIIHRKDVGSNVMEYWDGFFDIPDNSYLNIDPWSYKYFEKINNVILKEFTFKKNFTGENLNFLQSIKNEPNSVSIHIRRTDYIKEQSDYDVCDLNYFYKCVKIMSEKVPNPHFFIFSDDSDWIKRNFKIEFPYTIIDNNNFETCYEDLRLMSKCKHHIIPNSTFSWWAAWLNKSPNKIVIRPKKYLKSDRLKTSDLYPESWISVEN